MMSATTWVPLMAAMMLPSALPIAVRRGRAGVGFAVSYFVVWIAAAAAIYELGEPQSTIASVAVVTAAVLYELTPINRHCLARCRSSQIQSGFVYGLNCVGSSIGLMAVLAVLGLMSMVWMTAIAAVVFAQKLVPLPHLLTQGEPA
jgi:predicted metal-binding membrane protein